MLSRQQDHSITNCPHKSLDYQWPRSDIGYPYPIINTSEEDVDFNWDWLSGANMKYHNSMQGTNNNPDQSGMVLNGVGVLRMGEPISRNTPIY